MAEDQKILDQLQTIVTENTKLKLDKLEPSLNLEASGLDSFARINLVLEIEEHFGFCLLYTSPSPRDATLSRMPSSA